MSFKYGATAPKHNLQTMRSAIALALSFNELPPPPDTSPDWLAAILSQAPSFAGYDPNYPLDMALNATWGCCVISDIVHQRMLWSANTGTMMVTSSADIIKLYEIIGNFDPSQTQPDGSNPTDQGCNELDACNYLIKIGELAAAASIDPANYIHQKWAINLYGTIKYGIRVPDFAQDLYQQGKIWDVPNDGKPLNFEGSHDVCGIGYIKDGNTWLMELITWGRKQFATPTFLAACVTECHVPLSNVWAPITNANAPSSYDHDVLLAALNQAIKV